MRSVRAPKARVSRRNGRLGIRFCVRDLEKAHPWAEPRVLAYFASKSVQGPCAVASCKNQKNQTTNMFFVRKVTHARRRNAWADRD